MEDHLYVIRLGEISLKGLNRDFFESHLKDNIKAKLKPYHTKIARQKGRMFLTIDSQAPEAFVGRALSTTFGIVGFARSYQCPKDFSAITTTALSLVERMWPIQGNLTFKVETVRADKSFPMRSYDVSAELGALLLDSHPTLKVDVHTPQRTLFVELRDKAYLFSDGESGPGGLPVGTAGRGLVMLSGGIDSPVAAYRMARRGLRIEAVYFHAYPYTSDAAKEKVVSLARVLAPFCSKIMLHVVPFTAVQLHIQAHGRQEEATLMMRACMMRIATALARSRDCQCIVTGESLSQVASQTLESIVFTNSMTDLPVFRPLIGMDKEEIITTAKAVGTYDTSILPFEDCCTIFSPKHPLVKPKLEEVRQSYEQLQIESLLEEALENTEKLVVEG
jgi:thiamine biosynthesis protein ThiI